MKHKCNICGKEMKEVSDIDLKGFRVSGWRCTCGNEHTSPEDVDKIVKYFKAVKKGMAAKVYKSGNSISVRLPKPVADIFQLRPKSTLRVETKKDEVILKVPWTVK